ncbi:MAG TPA: YXWGXW repeat-containing protein [Lacunisphaera sp.]|jgi:hypothetical protein|nr:YXWGXW repeat-containing protein [Lacunisphaera sp.]
MYSTSPGHRSPPAVAYATARHLVHLCCGSFLVLLAGCAADPESHLVSAPPPSSPTNTVVTTTTTSAPLAAPHNGYAVSQTPQPVVSTVVVTQAPPALQPEVALAQPSSAHVWLAGYWTWRNDRYEWMAGHWELPPNSGAVWVAPRWERQGNAYKFTEGYWE